jgi:hypothetical protein
MSSEYANTIYCHLPFRYGLTRINGLDSIFTKETTIGSLFLDTNNIEYDTIPTFTKAAGVDPEDEIHLSSSPYLEIDKWDYCRVTDILTTVINQWLKRLGTTDVNLTRVFSRLTTEVKIVMSMFRYVGPYGYTSEAMINEAAQHVHFPRFDHLVTSISLIRSKFIDFSDCPQSKIFNQFSLVEGVDFETTDNTGETEAILQSQERYVLSGVYTRQ